jgi:small-conductance mechanosensitive channel
MECAQRHGRVLKEPPPEVLFEDFGADSLLFALYVWIDLKGGGVAREIQSDLRCMIAESFGKAGIVIAFPQRDIHLDSSTPLRVELIGG